MCSCMSVVPRREVSTGPRTVWIVAMSAIQGTTKEEFINMKTALICLLSFCALVSGQDMDKAGALARILARKGTISAFNGVPPVITLAANPASR